MRYCFIILELIGYIRKAPLLFLVLSGFPAIFPTHAQQSVKNGNNFIRPLPVEWPEWVKLPDISNPAYVCSNGDDNNPGTERKPYQSIKKALSLLASGRDVLLCRGGSWQLDETHRIVSKRNTEYAYIGPYGEGNKPYIKALKGVTFFENAEHFYFHDIKFEGPGYLEKGGAAFQVWDTTNYIVFNGVEINEFGLGFNVSEGRFDDNRYNTHFALINSRGAWNRSGFFFGGVSDHTFIDGNIAEYNGGFGGAHNYYLAGHWKHQTKNYVFQRNISRHAAPRNGKDGGACSRGSIVVHGYIDGLYMIDNEVGEDKGNAEHGCWGMPVDDGRAPDWGVESFPNLVYTGNRGMYTGNLLMGITSADDALIGWNEGVLDAAQDATGFVAPNKANGDTPINKITVVHNRFRIEGTVRNRATGINIEVPNVTLEHNRVDFEDSRAKCYVVNGVELQGDALGSNICKQVTP